MGYNYNYYYYHSSIPLTKGRTEQNPLHAHCTLIEPLDLAAPQLNPKSNEGFYYI